MSSVKKWGEWEIDEFIGEGSFGKVYKIVRKEFGFTYESALKIIRIPQKQSEYTSVLNEGMSEESVTSYFRSMVEDIVSEFALMAQLRGSSNIVSYEDHSVVKLKDEFGWEIFIRMELLTPLFDYLKQHTLTENDVIKIGIDLCKALEICQNNNIIHRDIKPENIFYSDIGAFKLGDFGIARQFEKTSASMSKKGTYTYMAPEVYKGLAYDSTVDLYSLGVVLYRYLNNNRTPFLPPYPETIMYSDREKANIKRMRGNELPFPCNASEPLGKVILKACSYNPAMRYQSAAEMREALEEVMRFDTDNKIVFSPKGNEPKSDVKTDNSDDETTVLMDEKEIEAYKTVYLFNQTESEKAGKEAEEKEKQEAEEKVRKEVAKNANRKAEEIIKRESEEEAKREAEEKEKKEAEEKVSKLKKNPKIWGIIAAIILIVVSVPLIYSYHNHIVPSVVGMNTTVAESKLNEEGLEFKVDERVFDDKTPRGQIVAQSYKKGEKVKRGTTVKVIVSKGKGIKAPDLYEKGIKSATEILKEKKLKIKQGRTEYSPKDSKSHKVKKGCIISQNYKKGTLLEEGTVVIVVVSKGAKQISVPKVVGMETKKAKKRLKKKGFRVSVNYGSSDSYRSGLIKSQSNTKKADQFSTIIITESTGPETASTNDSSNTSGYSSSGSESDSSSSGKGGGGRNNNEKSRTVRDGWNDLSDYY